MNSSQCVKVQEKLSPHIFKLENAGQKKGLIRCFGREGGGGKAKRTGKKMGKLKRRYTGCRD
jgi:hypothetical protein